MHDIKQRIEEANARRRRGEAFALATVVRVEGSAYRRPGARMLVGADGTTTGALSGGCLEGELAEFGREVLAAGAPRLVSFDVADDDPYFGFGSGCGGTVWVLVEPAGTPDDALALLQRCRDARRPGVLATVITDGPLLGRTLLVRDGAAEGAEGTLQPGPLRDAVAGAAAEVLADGHPRIVQHAEPGVAVLYEVVRPPVRLIVVGDGPDAPPLLRAAGLLHWDTLLVGRRGAAELAERFPEADAHLFLMHPEEGAATLPLDDRTAVVLMSHTFLRDRALLGVLLDAPVAYVGALGPRHRTEQMLDGLREAGLTFTDAQLARLYGPTGLDLGSETPAEIALAIVAEIQAVLHGRDAASLRRRSGPIHEAVPVAREAAARRAEA